MCKYLRHRLTSYEGTYKHLVNYILYIYQRSLKVINLYCFKIPGRIIIYKHIGTDNFHGKCLLLILIKIVILINFDIVKNFLLTIILKTKLGYQRN